jgi:hypothetical protein
VFNVESGDSEYAGWKLLFNDAQVALFSGGASYELPLELPPGRGGVTPRLALGYNSRRVDGITSWVQSEWAGLGWTIDTPQIVRKIRPGRNWMWGWADYANQFTLLLDGASYELIPESPNQYYGRYHTKTESFFYIERRNAPWCAAYPARCVPIANVTSEYWTVRTPGGLEYRFGATPDSEQLVRFTHYYGDDWPNGQPPRDYRYAGEARWAVTYRWRLDRVRDLDGNTAVYRYDEQSDGLRDYASYLREVAYVDLRWALGLPRVVRAPPARRRARSDRRRRSRVARRFHLVPAGLPRPRRNPRPGRRARARLPTGLRTDARIRERVDRRPPTAQRDARRARRRARPGDHVRLPRLRQGSRGIGCQCWDGPSAGDRLVAVDGYGGRVALEYGTFDDGWWHCGITT